MNVTGAVVTQQSLLQTNIQMSVLKQANDQKQAMVDLLTASVDAHRGRNLDVRV